MAVLLGRLLLLLLVAVAAASSAIELPPANAQQHPAPALPLPRQPHQKPEPQLHRPRSEPNAPDGYVPSAVSCPSPRPSIRRGTGLGPDEKAWLPRRRNATIEPMRDLLKRLDIPGFNSDDYLRGATANSSALPNIGLAISGGGYRAMLNGAGALAAWDARSSGSDADGNLGGLLQSSTYLSGLSGGGWLVGSLYVNNFTSVQASVNSPSFWQFDSSIFSGPDQYSLLGYYRDIFDDVSNKADAGFDRSITDYWGRMLSYQLVNASDGGPAYTFSSIANLEAFSSASIPLPFLVADSRYPDETLVSLNSTVFEFSPWELGSSDPTLRGFVPLKYAGSNFSAGSLAPGADCISGFDNAGYVMGTSSSLFNQIVLYLNDPSSSYVPSGIPSFVTDALTTVLNHIGDKNNDIADWSPNPFLGFNATGAGALDNGTISTSDRLALVDGGEDLQNIPYHPHLLSARAVDVVFSVDSSADTDSLWPDGASAIATYERSLAPIADGTAFPPVPGKDTFLNLGLNSRPVFFGCDATNGTSSKGPPPPLIVYLPNYPYLYASNISTFQMVVNNSQRDAIVQNGWAVATQLNATRDRDWPSCVACAVLARSFARTATDPPDRCRDCFQRYCWNGTLDESAPAPYRPSLFSSQPIEVQNLGAARLAGSALATCLAAVAVAFLLAL